MNIKYIVAVLFLLNFGSLFCQTGAEVAYRVGVNTYWEYTDKVRCHREVISALYIGENNDNYGNDIRQPYNNFLSYIPGWDPEYTGWNYKTFVLSSGSNTLTLHWHDENIDHVSRWRRWTFSLSTIPDMDSTYEYSKDDDGWWCRNYTRLIARVQIFDAVNIRNIRCQNPSSPFLESGTQQCVESPSSSQLVFELRVRNKSDYTTFYIEALSINGNDTTIIANRNMGSYGGTFVNNGYESTVSVVAQNLIPGNYYDKPIRFRTKTYVQGGKTIKGAVTREYRFFKPFPRPGVTAIAPTCHERVDGKIQLTYSVNSINRYVFTLSQLIQKIDPSHSCSDNFGDPGFSECQYDPNYCLTGRTANSISGASNSSLIIDGANFLNNPGLNGIGAGPYELKVETDDDACSFGMVITVPDKPELLLEEARPANNYIWDLDTFNIQSYGSVDGIYIRLSGGNSPYSYLVDGAAVSTQNYSTSFQYPNALAGSHVISIQDRNLCQVNPESRQVMMRQPDPVSVVVTSTDTVSCHRENEGTHDDGTVQLSVTGGIGPFSVTADTVVTDRYNSFTNQENYIQLSGFMARDYILTIHDRFGSTNTVPVSFTSRPRLLLDPISEDDMTWPYCIGGANGTLIASGYGGSPFSGLLGKYKYFAEGYIDTVTADTALLENLRSGLHNILIEDKYGCRDRNDSVIIPENPNPLKLFLVDTIRPTCNEYLDGTASFTGRDGSPYKTFPAGYDFTLINLKTYERQSLRNDTVLFEGLGSANYEISIQDTAQCEANNQYRDTVFLSEPAPIRIRTRVHQVSRKGIPNGSITAVLTGANKNYIYEWYKHLTAVEDSFLLSGTTRDTAYIDGLPAGDYLLRVRDTVGCSNGHGADGWFEWSCTIKEPVYSLGFRLFEQRNVSCHGLSDGSIVIEGVGGWGDNYLYGLQPDQLTPDRVISNLPAGLYTVYVADEEDEMYYDTIRISEPEILTMVANEITPVDCYGNYSGRVAVDVTGGTSPYYLSVDSSTNTTQETGITGLPAGIYGITVTDTNGCQAHIEAVIEQPDSIHIELIGQINTLCNEAIGSIETTVSGGIPAYNYTWMNSADTLDNNSSAIGSLEADIYKLIVTDQNACEKESPWYTILNSDGPVIADTVITPVSCYNYSDGRVEILADSLIVPYTYSWSNGQSTNLATGLPSGNCFVTVTDEKQCNLYAAIYVPSPDSLSLVALSVIDPQCAGYTNGSIQIDATGGTPEYQFTWNTGDTGNTVVGLRSGNYYVTITDAHQCTNTGQLVLNNPEPVYIDLGGETTICTGQTVTLDAGEFELYSWRFGDSLLGNNRTAELMEAGDYYLEVLNEEGCIGKDTFTVYTANDLLNADFLIKSEAYTDDTVVAINISWPLPDSVNWIYDKNLILGISEQDYEYLIFDKPGTYLITLYAALGGCKDNYTHEIAIVERGNEDELKFGVAEDLIKEFIVHPNPTDGLFTVEVKLSRIHDIALRLFDYSNLIDQKVVRNMKDYEIGYDLHPMKPGVYVLQLIAGKEQKTLKIIYY